MPLPALNAQSPGESKSKQWGGTEGKTKWFLQLMVPVCPSLIFRFINPDLFSWLLPGLFGPRYFGFALQLLTLGLTQNLLHPKSCPRGWIFVEFPNSAQRGFVFKLIASY